jgi:mono/diheme cytochrome c family protein
MWSFLAAATLVVFAVVGFMLLSRMGQRDGMEQPKPDAAETDTADVEATEDKPTYSSLGESIYYAGIGSKGRDIPYTAGPEWMKTTQERGCVNCHGADGKGGFPMATDSKEAPSVTYDSLASEVHYHGGQREIHAGRYTDEAIKQAIAQGIDPSGKELDAMMPRWKMTDAELTELLRYLKEL